MTKQNHKTGFLVAAMVFSAIALRVLGKFDILIVPGGIAHERPKRSAPGMRPCATY